MTPHLLRSAGRSVGLLLDRLIPPACAVCRTIVPPGPPLCGICESRLIRVPYPHCARCGATRTSPLDDPTCALCDPWPAPLARAASAVLHAPPADLLVAGLKYRGWTALAPRLAEFMTEPAGRLAAGGDARPVLVPVPLDPRRARRRGFNQAALLARHLSRLTGWRHIESGLRRRTSRRRQAELGRAERLANVTAAFSWRPGVAVPASPLLLVDDVLTTGATAAACAGAIAAGGGACVGVVTFARAIPRPDAV